jgi:hypothetical protein
MSFGKTLFAAAGLLALLGILNSPGRRVVTCELSLRERDLPALVGPIAGQLSRQFVADVVGLDEHPAVVGKASRVPSLDEAIKDREAGIVHHDQAHQSGFRQSKYGGEPEQAGQETKSDHDTHLLSLINLAVLHCVFFPLLDLRSRATLISSTVGIASVVSSSRLSFEPKIGAPSLSLALRRARFVRLTASLCASRILLFRLTLEPSLLLS